MSAPATVYVKCRFTRGGFAHERVFWIDAPGGGEYRGLAYIGHCLSAAKKPLRPDEPPPGKSIDGLLEARRLSDNPDGSITIEVPDGELCDIDAVMIWGARDVLVGS